MTTKLTEELDPGDVVMVAGRLRIVRARTAVDGGFWDLDLDPRVVEIPTALLRRPSGETWNLYNGQDVPDLASRIRQRVQRVVREATTTAPGALAMLYAVALDDILGMIEDAG